MGQAHVETCRGDGSERSPAAAAFGAMEEPHPALLGQEGVCLHLREISAGRLPFPPPSQILFVSLIAYVALYYILPVAPPNPVTTLAASLQQHVAMLNSKSKGPSPLSPADIIRLHEFEMSYAITTILQFREVAVAVFNAQELFMKRKKSKSGMKKYSQKQFSKALSWRDVLSILTILKEEQRGVISYVSPVSAGGKSTHEETHRSTADSVDDFDVQGHRSTSDKVRRDEDSTASLTSAVLEAVAQEGFSASGRSLLSDYSDMGASASSADMSLERDLGEGQRSPAPGDSEKWGDGDGAVSRTPDPISGGTPVATPPGKQTMAQSAAKLFSNRRMSTGATPDTHSAGGTPEGAKGSGSKVPTGRASVGGSVAARKSTLLNTMSAAMGGGKSSSSKRASQADEHAGGGHTIGESRFNTLLARTLHSSDGKEDTGPYFCVLV